MGYLLPQLKGGGGEIAINTYLQTYKEKNCDMHTTRKTNVSQLHLLILSQLLENSS